MEIDEGVRKVSQDREPYYLLHYLTFGVGILAFVESWIQSNGGFWIWGQGDNIQLHTQRGCTPAWPFFLWIGGALVLSQIGATGPQILNRIFGWSPAISDIRRGLRGSGSSKSVSQLSLILLLTPLDRHPCGCPGHTGTLVDERTTNAQNGADLKLQLDTTLTEEEARSRVIQSIEVVDDNDISGINSMTSVANIFTQTKEDSILLTWVVFDGHEDSLIWDRQAIPGSDIGDFAASLAGSGFTAGDLAEDSSTTR